MPPEVLATEPAPVRRPRRRLPLLAWLAAGLVLLGTSTSVGAIEPSTSPNRLDHPFLDVVLLAPRGPDGAPRLLVLDAVPPAPGTAHLSMLQRDRAWLQVGSLTVDIDLGADGEGIDRPWLVGLDPTTVALVVPVQASARTDVVLLRTDGGPGGADLVEVERAVIPGLVASGGRADVDGDGAAELVLVTQQACEPAHLWTLRPDTFDVVAPAAEIAGYALRGGVIGRWDDVPGDDLLVWAVDECTAVDAAAPTGLDAIRLLDGAPIVRGLDVAAPETDFLGSPLRLDLDATDPAAPPLDEVVIRGRRGLTILDPAADWDPTVIARGDAVPLGILAGADGAHPALAYVDVEGDGIVTRTVVGREPDGIPAAVTSTALPAEGGVADRIRRLSGQAAIGLLHDRPGVVWQGSIAGDGCVDALIQGARFGCAGDALEPGAAWIGTRPLATLGEGRSRRLLVAAGLESDVDLGLPSVPTPDATGLSGWWRQGASPAFSLAELRAGDAAYYQEFPEPRSSVERVSGPDGSTDLPGFTGTRLLFLAAATRAVDDAPTDDVAPEALFAGDAQPGEIRTILRIPVPPGLDSGRDGASVRVPLADAALPDGSAAGAWALRVLPVNDWGEVGDLAAGIVTRDATGPTLVLGEPFTTPVWPLSARLTGSAEPGSTVVIDGVGEAALDRRGGFAFDTTLAPWPQTIRASATDASGNVTIREVSIIGGIDYRRFPWTVIAAVVIVVAVGASAVRGVRGRPVIAGPEAGQGGRGSVHVDDWSGAEIEELEPGAGLPRGSSR